MLFSSIITFFMLAATSLASNHHHGGPAKRQSASTTTSGPDYNKLQELLGTYMSTMTVNPMVSQPTETLGISVPPELQQQIMTAVPMKVLISLMNPEYRTSVASDFANGNTPGWYQSMDPTLQSYFENMAASIQTGNAVFTRSSTTPTPTPTGEADSPEGNSEPSSSSSDGAAVPTAAVIDNGVLAGVVGMAGVLGVALAL